MDVCIIIKQIENFDPKNWMKIITLKKWLIMIPNRKHYKHPPIAPPNLGTNLTSFECCEPLKTILKTSNLGNEFALYGSNFKIEIKNFSLEGFKILQSFVEHAHPSYALIIIQMSFIHEQIKISCN